MGCAADVPDCEHCPYPDCMATIQDINRQEAIKSKAWMEKRNKSIVDDFRCGATVEGLSEKYGICKSGILHILRKAGIRHRRKHESS